MKTVQNKTTKAVAVPLPRGRKLHLGPRQSGEISVHDVDHPPLVRLVEAGSIEIQEEGDRSSLHAKTGGAIHSSTQGHPADKTVRKRGDR